MDCNYMYDETFYKAFMTETAAKIAAELCKNYTSFKDIGFLLEKRVQADISSVSISMAGQLADSLHEWWEKTDSDTLLFDAVETPAVDIGRRLVLIAEQLENISNKMGKQGTKTIKD